MQPMPPPGSPPPEPIIPCAPKPVPVAPNPEKPESQTGLESQTAQNASA
jgi:hypothetical protein